MAAKASPDIVRETQHEAAAAAVVVGMVAVGMVYHAVAERPGVVEVV